MTARADIIAQARALEAEGLSDYEVSRRMGRSSSWWSVTRARAGLERLPRPPSDRTARVTALVTPEERDTLTERLDSTASELDTTKDSLDTASADLADANAQIGDLTGQVGDLTSQVEDLQTQLDVVPDLTVEVELTDAQATQLGQSLGAKANPALTDTEAACFARTIFDELGLEAIVQLQFTAAPTAGQLFDLGRAIGRGLAQCNIEPSRLGFNL